MYCISGYMLKNTLFAVNIKAEWYMNLKEFKNQFANDFSHVENQTCLHCQHLCFKVKLG